MDMVVSFPGGKRVDASFRGLTVKTDQPKQAGGEGAAPSPFEVFLASVGTCAGIYVLGFCQQRGIPTEDIRIVQSLDVNPATYMIEQINLDIQLPKDFPAQYKEAVIRSAQMCAVKKHLENPPKFNIQTTIGS